VVVAGIVSAEALCRPDGTFSVNADLTDFDGGSEGFIAQAVAGLVQAPFSVSISKGKLTATYSWRNIFQADNPAEGVPPVVQPNLTSGSDGSYFCSPPRPIGPSSRNQLYVLVEWTNAASESLKPSGGKASYKPTADDRGKQIGCRYAIGGSSYGLLKNKSTSVDQVVSTPTIKGESCGSILDGEAIKTIGYTVPSVEHPATCGDRVVKSEICVDGTLTVHGPSILHQTCVVNGAPQVPVLSINGSSPASATLSIDCQGNESVIYRLARKPYIIYEDLSTPRTCSDWNGFNHPYLYVGSKIYLLDMSDTIVAEVNPIEGGGGGDQYAQTQSSADNLKLFMAPPLGRFWKNECSLTSGGQCDLTGADLSGLDLSGADLSNVRLSGCDLTSANLSGLNLVGNVFDSCDMTGSNLADSDLSEASFINVNLSSSSLAGSVMTNAYFNSVNFSGSTGLSASAISSAEFNDNMNFSGLSLDGFDFSGQRLSSTNFSGTSLVGAIFDLAYLRYANFSGADLDGATFDGIFSSENMSNLTFAGASLVGSSFKDTYLVAVDFSGADLRDADFSASDYYTGDWDGSKDKTTSTRLLALDFTNADLRRARFNKRTIGSSSFPGSNLDCSDFTEATGGPFSGKNRCSENSSGFACETPGTYDTGTTCELAPLHFYAVLGSTEPTACPAGTVTSGLGASSEAACFCPAGSFQPEGGSCTISPSNHFAPLGATEPTACPVDTTSPEGSDSVDDCQAPLAPPPPGGYSQFAFTSVSIDEYNITFQGKSGSCAGVSPVSFQRAEVVDQTGAVVASRTQGVSGKSCIQLLNQNFGDGPGRISFMDFNSTLSLTPGTISELLLRFVSSDGSVIIGTPYMPSTY
jgi:uncharacterized protein YjbI with pentapeptide repeats